MPPKLTQPLRPAARYRKGQAPVRAPASDSDSDQEEQLEQPHSDAQDGSDDDVGVQEYTSGGNQRAEKAKAMGIKLDKVQVDQQGKVKVGGKDEVGRTEMESSEGEYETDTDEEPSKTMPKPTFTKLGPSKPAVEEESSEYETDSEEEEEPLKPIYKPVFVSKRNRDTIAEREKELDPDIVEAKRAAEIEKQKEDSKNLVADSIVRELAEKETQSVQPDVDDTDGLDPEGEFEEWKLRELTRLKRDKEARYALEKIKEEVEARRTMPEALRLKEDTERADKTRKEKKKGSQVFLQKYHHKGAFHQDLDILKKHDYTAPTLSTVDVSSLPEVLQKRNFGKMSQSKYTHLADQDTSRKRDEGFGKFGGGSSSGNSCFNCGGPHLKRECPQLNEAGPSGSNSSSLPSTSRTPADGGWGDRRPPPPSSNLSRPAEEDRFARPSGNGKRGGIGFERDQRRERRRSRSRSPPPSRLRYDERDDRRAGGGSSREYRRRSRSRSRSPPPRNKYNDDRRYDDRRSGDRDRDRDRVRERGSRDRERDDEREKRRKVE